MMDTDGKASKGTPKKPRMISVKIGSQASRQMSPEEAADYLKNIATKGAFGGAREMKLTFGKGGTATASVGPASSSKLPGPSFSTQSSKRKDPSMPCSEKEMKALMSMFVEIMGLQMNTDKLNKPRKASKNLFKFPDDLPPPPGGWPKLWPSDNDDDSVDSVPELMDFDAELYRITHPHLMSVTTVQPPAAVFIPDVEPEPVTGLEGIVPLEWDSLERMAIEDALEQEERARKNSNKAKDTKKSWKKEKARKEAQVKAQEELVKKRDKNLATWKSRVSSSMQSMDQLEDVLATSPLNKDDLLGTRKELMDSLIPLCMPKNRAFVDKGRDVRERLISFILDLSPETILLELRNGRSLFHTACFYGDVGLIRAILLKIPATTKKELIERTCLDSGLLPSHYAALSGSFETVEALLANRFPFNVLTNDTHTWRASNGKGLTPRQLLECLVQKPKEIESHGMAMPELFKDFLVAPHARGYLALVERLAGRLKNVEEKGFTPLTQEEIAQEVEFVREASADGHESLCSTGEEECKQSKQTHSHVVDDEGSDDESVDTEDDSQSELSTERSETVATTAKAPTQGALLTADDPLVTALLQMGFDQEQVFRGIEACGGAESAVPDDVVAWIFTQDNDTDQVGAVAESFTMRKDDRKPAVKDNKSRRVQNKKNAEAKRLETARKAEEERLAAEHLAAKREEQRRRNREWNSRTQARQLQEVETGLKTVGLDEGPALVTGVDLAPSSTKLPYTHTAENSHGPSLEQSIANDASTIGSIVEINVEANDDQTVSTLGSWQHTRPPPLPVQQFGQSRTSAPQVLPPGFNHGMIVPPSQAISHTGPENMDRDLLPQNMGFSCPPSRLETPLMPGQLAAGALSGQEGMRQPQLATALDTISGSGMYGLSSNGSSSRMQSAANPVLPEIGAYGSTGLSLSPFGVAAQHGIQGSTMPAPVPTMPNPSPIGFSLNPQQSNHTESSFIDSISTGGAMLGDTLWHEHHGSGAVGSSLLGNVIQSNSNLRGGAGVIGGGVNRDPTAVLQNPFRQPADERSPGWNNLGNNCSSFW